MAIWILICHLSDHRHDRNKICRYVRMRQLTIQSFFMMIDKDRKGWVTVEELEAEIRRNNSLRMNSTQVIIIVFLT